MPNVRLPQGRYVQPRLEALENRVVPTKLPTGFADILVAGGLKQPTAMEIAPDGRIFVTELAGNVRVIKNGQLLQTPFLTVDTSLIDLGGLLGLTFHPNFTDNGYVYIHYTSPNEYKHQHLSRFKSDPNNPDVALSGSEEIVLHFDNMPASTHLGGAIHFGEDGKLYVPVGDNNNPANGQYMWNTAGKVLRLNPDGSIPPDNPFADGEFGKPEIWAWGYRNPFTFAVQPGTGRIFVNDVGSSDPQRREEVNELKKGENYGWATHEGYTADGGFQSPIFAYGTGFAGYNCSVAGAAFYNPAVNQFPATYSGRYFFADLCGGWIYSLDPDAPDPKSTVTPFATELGGNPVDLDVGAGGSLYYLEYSKGQVRRIGYQNLAGASVFAVGGENGRVQVRYQNTGDVATEFAPFGDGYGSAVSVALGDVNNDGSKDLIVSTKIGTAKVHVYDGASLTGGILFLLADWSPYADEFNLGVNVAVGDVNNDGFADVVTGATIGNPHVRIYDGQDVAAGSFDSTASLLTEFFAYGLNFNIGANVAAGDVNNDGFADIVTGATAGNPHVQVYSGRDAAAGLFNTDSSRLASWFAYGMSFNVGANVATGDVDGDGFLDVITGATNGNPHVRAYSGSDIAAAVSPLGAAPALLDEFFAYQLQFNVGVTLASTDFDGDGKADLLTGASAGSPHFRVVKANATGVQPPALNGIEGIPPNWFGGITVAA